MGLRKYEELDTAHRGDPCAEYPGTYYIYHNGNEVDTFTGAFGETFARDKLRRVMYHNPLGGTFSLAWKASDTDPRIGQVWFTGYYTVAERKV